MTMHPYTYDLKHAGVDVISDLECLIDADAEFWPGDEEPRLNVYGLRIVGWPSQGLSDGCNPLDKDAPLILKHLGKAILAAASQDHVFQTRVFEAQGITFTGRYGNDPDGVWRAA